MDERQEDLRAGIAGKRRRAPASGVDKDIQKERKTAKDLRAADWTIPPETPTLLETQDLAPAARGSAPLQRDTRRLLRSPDHVGTLAPRPCTAHSQTDALTRWLSPTFSLPRYSVFVLIACILCFDRVE